MVAVVIIATIFLDHFIVDARKVQQWPAIILLVLVSIVAFHLTCKFILIEAKSKAEISVF